MSEAMEKQQLEGLAASAGRMADVVDSGQYETVVKALADLTGKVAKANPAHLDALFPPSKETIECRPAEQSPMYREWTAVWSRIAANIAGSNNQGD